jgi:SAM-dependent methyltransferase
MNAKERAESDRERWNRKYADRQGPAHFRPSHLLVEHRHLIAEMARHASLPDGGPPSVPRALDVACGFGGNALYLASTGFQVDAVDISGVALAQLQAEAARRGLRLRLRLVQADLTRWWVPPSHYDLIIVTYYLNRDLMPQLSRGLCPGGLLFVETHNIRFLLVRPDFDPAFLLRPGELCQFARDTEMQVIQLADDGSEARTSQLVALRPA